MFSFMKKKEEIKPVERKEILLMGSIDDESIKPIIEEILKLKKEDFDGHLDIYISSDGGYVGSALSLITMMDSINGSKNYKFKIHTVALREVYSSAFLIWVCGYSRSVTKHSSALIHGSSGAVEGSIIDVKSFIGHFDEENKIITDILDERTNLGREAIGKMLSDNTDHFFNSDQMLKMASHNVWLTKLDAEEESLDLKKLVKNVKLPVDNTIF